MNYNTNLARHYTKNALLLLFCCGISLVAHAIGFYIPDQDTEATARAATFVAKADNPSAVYYNPAGLMQLDGVQVSGTLYGIWAKTTYKGISKTSSDSDPQFLPQLYATYHPQNKPVAFGLGISTPYGLGGDWGESPLRQVVIRNQMQYMAVNLSMAWQVTPSLSIAVGPTFNYSKLEIKQGLAPVDLGDVMKFNGDGTSWGGQLGLLWKPIDKVSFGAVYRYTQDIDYEGDLDVQPGALPLPAGSFPASMKAEIPQQVSFGVGYQITERWQIEVDALWTQWSCWDTITLKNPLMNAQTPYHWKDSWIWSVGASYQATSSLKIHAGYGYAQETAPQETMTAAIPDSPRHVLCLGLTKTFGKFSGSLALQQIFGEERNIDNGMTLPGKYSTHSTAVTTSFRYQF